MKPIFMHDLDRSTKQEQQCCQELSDDRSGYERIFQQLVTAYTRPDRYYHNLEHIDCILAVIDQFSGTLNQPLAVYLVAWFHDVVYDSQASDNEIPSAKLARESISNIDGSNYGDRFCLLEPALSLHCNYHSLLNQCPVRVSR